MLMALNQVIKFHSITNCPPNSSRKWKSKSETFVQKAPEVTHDKKSRKSGHNKLVRERRKYKYFSLAAMHERVQNFYSALTSQS